MHQKCLSPSPRFALGFPVVLEIASIQSVMPPNLPPKAMFVPITPVIIQILSATTGDNDTV